MDKAKEKDVQEAFAFYDRDNDGKLSLEEFGVLIRSLNQPLTETELNKVIADTDKENAKSVSLEQVMECMSTLYANPIDAEGRARHAFSVMDQDKDEKISAQELRHYLTKIGDKLSDQQVDYIYANAHVTNDMALDVEAFLSMLGVKK
eukprot:TRINITY_DN3255_c0_g1_i1.p2 TRINITY_DN3255_c0_g1~~TRINITY_DN3255_c0_g1_i1.p2  ORF type:complete len:155 (+),score=70.11 TRINITY_DN3255_c0_g1_i1:23-466(+)